MLSFHRSLSRAVKDDPDPLVEYCTGTRIDAWFELCINSYSRTAVIPIKIPIKGVVVAVMSLMMVRFASCCEQEHTYQLSVLFSVGVNWQCLKRARHARRMPRLGTEHSQYFTLISVHRR